MKYNCYFEESGSNGGSNGYLVTVMLVTEHKDTFDIPMKIKKKHKSIFHQEFKSHIFMKHIKKPEIKKYYQTILTKLNGLNISVYSQYINKEKIKTNFEKQILSTRIKVMNTFIENCANDKIQKLRKEEETEIAQKIEEAIENDTPFESVPTFKYTKEFFDNCLSKIDFRFIADKNYLNKLDTIAICMYSDGSMSIKTYQENVDDIEYKKSIKGSIWNKQFKINYLDSMTNKGIQAADLIAGCLHNRLKTTNQEYSDLIKNIVKEFKEVK